MEQAIELWMSPKAFQNKAQVRQWVWRRMEENDLVVFPRPCYGKIPNFAGSRHAAEKLKGLEEWKKAKVVFASPDSSLRSARWEALKDGKLLIVAAQRLKGFFLLEKVPVEKRFEASSITGFDKFGKKVAKPTELPKVDLYLTGAVAVDQRGNRIGEGTGYGDQEESLLYEAGLMDTATPRVALVHDAQVFTDFSSLMGAQDRKISLIVTPQKIFRVG